MNTIQYSPKVVHYMQQMFPWAHRVVDANGISIASAIFAKLTRWQTDWLTDSRAHSGEAKFCYCLRLQQVFIGAADLTDRSNFSNQQLYSAVRLDGLMCMWRHTTIL